MKKVSLVRKNTKTTKILIAEDGRKLGCPYGDGTAQCGTWCALFDIAKRPAIDDGMSKNKMRSWVMCRESLIGELIEDSIDSSIIESDHTKHQA